MVLKGGGRSPTKIGIVPLLETPARSQLTAKGLLGWRIGDQTAGCLRLCLWRTISPRYAAGSWRGLR